MHLANCKNGTIQIIVPKQAGLVALVAHGTSFCKIKYGDYIFWGHGPT